MGFMRWRYLFLSLSLVLILSGAIVAGVHGVRLGIDFTGGSLMEVKFQNPDVAHRLTEREQAQQVIGDTFEVQSVQAAGPQTLIFRGKTISEESKEVVFKKLKTLDATAQLDRFTAVGPTIGQELVQKTIAALVIGAVGIALYIWRQFKDWRFGVSAVMAALHDSLVLLSVFVWCGWLFGAEIDVLFVTALLTTLSFSVHDTIVMFDQFRELRKHFRFLRTTEVAEIAVLSTLNRSVVNSLTTIIMLISLAILGGDTIRWFVVALLVGSITGTYSSPCVAVPLVVVWEDLGAMVTRWRRRK
jgi:preprotein translocase subunit SecF